MGAQHAGRRRRPPRARQRREEFSATEVAEDEKPALLRAYLEKWKWEVGAFFDGVGPDAPDEELRRIGPDHPAFRIDFVSAQKAPLVLAARKARKKITPQLTAMIPISRRTICEGDLLLGLGGQRLEVDLAELALGGADAGALGDEGDDQGKDPVEVVEVFRRFVVGDDQQPPERA